MARQDVNEALLETSFLYGANAAYIEELQAAYARNPSSVDPEWQTFFKGLGEDETLDVGRLAQDFHGVADQLATASEADVPQILDRFFAETRVDPSAPEARAPMELVTEDVPPAEATAAEPAAPHR